MALDGSVIGSGVKCYFIKKNNKFENILHEIYDLNRFLSVQYSIVIYRCNIVHQTHKTYTSFITEILYTFISKFPFFPPSRPWK